MSRDEYKSVLLSKGFKFEKTTLSYPGWRGDEDIYTKKPEYKYTFRIFRMYREKSDYGLYVGVGDQFRHIDDISAHDTELESSKGTLPMWTGASFLALMDEI